MYSKLHVAAAHEAGRVDKLILAIHNKFGYDVGLEVVRLLIEYAITSIRTFVSVTEQMLEDW